MNTDTPRTDAGCAPVYFNNGTSTIAADPEISRQLELELNVAKRTIEKYEAALKKITTENYTMPEARFVASTALRP